MKRKLRLYFDNSTAAAPPPQPAVLSRAAHPPSSQSRRRTTKTFNDVAVAGCLRGSGAHAMAQTSAVWSRNVASARDGAERSQSLMVPSEELNEQG